MTTKPYTVEYSDKPIIAVEAMSKLKTTHMGGKIVKHEWQIVGWQIITTMVHTDEVNGDGWGPNEPIFDYLWNSPSWKGSK
jgi:hypothetical protein